jgi:hypothetical protein
MNFYSTNINDIRRELACDQTTALEVARQRGIENAALIARWHGRKRELLAAARKTYQDEVAAYLIRRPEGRNAAKAALRAARKVWSGFEAWMV